MFNRRFVTIAIVALLFFVGCTLFVARSVNSSATLSVTEKDIATRFNQIKKDLGETTYKGEVTESELKQRIENIEEIVGRISESENISKNILRELEVEMLGLANASREFFYRQGINPTIEAARTQMKEGNINALGRMEKVIKKTRDQMRIIVEKLHKIQDDIFNCNGKFLDINLIEDESSQVLRNSLSDKCLEIYGEKKLISYSRLKDIKALTIRGRKSSLFETCLTCSKPNRTFSAFLHNIISGIIPNAYADIAEGCVDICSLAGSESSLENLSNCFICCTTAGEGGYEAWDAYTGCEMIHAYVLNNGYCLLSFLDDLA